MEKENICHDCKKEIKIKEDGEIEGAQLLKYELPDGRDRMVFKCNECFKKDKSLRNFQETEVYSRVVGYLRPVNQWNEGKQQEFKKRKEFSVSKSLKRVK